MYLSRLLLSSASRQVQAELWQPYQLHRTVLRAFAAFERPQRILYRLDLGDMAPTLLVQSPVPPDWGFLPEDYVCRPGGDPGVAMRFYEPVLERGQRLAFRLRANPTQRHDGKRRAWLDEQQQQSWLERKGARHGFTVVSATIESEGLVCLTKRAQESPLQLCSVLFQGALEVTDAALCAQAVHRGIGGGKAFGFGLLSLAPG